MLPSLEGKPLSELLHGEQLTLEEILLVLVRAMDRVAAAHALGVLHRKLKPSNIRVRMSMSGRFDDPRVLDLTDGEDGATNEAVHYMSLEQLEGQPELDARVDVHAMGVILYEAISGVLPHHAESADELALELKHMPTVQLGMRRPDLPRGLAEAVMRAIATDRDARYPTMRAFIDALLPFVPADTVLTVRELPPRPRAPRERVSEHELMHAPSSTRLAAPRVPTELMLAARPAEAQGSLAPHRTSLRARVLGAVGALSVTAAALAGARLLSWSSTESKVQTSTEATARPRPSAPDRFLGASAGVPHPPDAGHFGHALAAQPRGTITVTSWITAVDGGWPPHTLDTTETSDQLVPAAVPEQ